MRKFMNKYICGKRAKQPVLELQGKVSQTDCKDLDSENCPVTGISFESIKTPFNASYFKFKIDYSDVNYMVVEKDPKKLPIARFRTSAALPCLAETDIRVPDIGVGALSYSKEVTDVNIEDYYENEIVCEDLKDPDCDILLKERDEKAQKYYSVYWGKNPYPLHKE